MEGDLLEFATQGIYALAFVLTLITFLRHQDLPRFEVMALFAVLAIALDLELITDLLSVDPPGTEVVSALALVAQPFVFLRLVGHFRPIPVYQQVFALLALLMSWAVLVITEPTLSVTETLVVIGVFLYVEGYATIALIQSTRASRGVTRWRQLVIIWGSAFIAAAIFLLGLGEAVSATEDVASDFLMLGALGSALCYYAGFAPPQWLRRALQQA